jgi:hypothetical protein
LDFNVPVEFSKKVFPKKESFNNTCKIKNRSNRASPKRGYTKRSTNCFIQRHRRPGEVYNLLIR